MRLYLEELCENVSYEALGEWTVPNISRFSHNKTLFHYQIDAMKNAAKVLYHYFNAENGKQTFYAECTERGMPSGAFRVQKFARPIDRTRGLVDVRYSFLRNYFQPVETDNDGFIPGNSFFNRMAFWMATGSGKSLVIIKMIEYLYYLQARDLIPKKDIMLLLPREHLITQFKQEIQNYNLYADVPIELINLLDYEEDQRTPTLLNVFRVYYYRSDLVRDERKTVELDFRDYDNKGDWYIFLDEAHRGETGASKLQDYVSILSRNGFLFNFSATFVDAIDFATTGYNFNLERFIGAGYGKNIYLADSYFDFKKDRDDFNEREKQRQVLKSLMTLAMLKIARKECTYHTPLMMTLVNSVNTEDSDLLLFFEKIEEIASGKMDNDLFEESKQELMRDFGNPEYVFGRERFGFRSEWLDDLRLEDILVSVFNTENHGKIEIIEGEKGKELVLKLETTDKPFALIKIGAADTFQKEKLGSNYSFVSGYESRNYFERINDNEDISILLGSRGFYEGWDSNRPNVINFINIGGRDAQRYVAQSIGRGVRIQPKGGRRQRLPLSDPDKNLLLETLFIFATDKSGVKAILNTIDEQKATNEYDLALSKTEERVFDLLIPVFGNSGDRADVAHFNIAEQSKSKFRQYFNYFDQNTLLIKTGLALDNYKLLNDKINDETLFQTDDRKVYGDMAMLLRRITEHVGIKNKVVGGIKELEDEIIHFQHIKVIDMGEDLTHLLEEKIRQVKDFEQIDKKQLASDFAADLITEAEFLRLLKAEAATSFKDLEIVKMAQHYYVPLIYSKKEKVEYVRRIIGVESEVKFIEDLIDYLQDHQPEADWMFSKIDESLDYVHIPYYNRTINSYSKFFPDFIFWIHKGKKYKIVFVDPKGTAYADYQNKVDEFERIFTLDGQPRSYSYKDFEITFDLRLITDDINAVGAKYRDYWLGRKDFSFLEL